MNAYSFKSSLISSRLKDKFMPRYFILSFAIMSEIAFESASLLYLLHGISDLALLSFNPHWFSNSGISLIIFINSVLDLLAMIISSAYANESLLYVNYFKQGFEFKDFSRYRLKRRGDKTLPWEILAF